MKTRKKSFNQQDVIKAINKANREISFIRNGGGHFVVQTKPHKNKKAYDRKKDKRGLNHLLSLIILFLFLILVPCHQMT